MSWGGIHRIINVPEVGKARRGALINCINKLLWLYFNVDMER